ncbi:MAG: hypothetical protein ACQERZ_00455 [Fusobacteriota bacterium]
MKKTIFFMILLISISGYGETVIPSGNDDIYFEFDTKNFLVSNIKSKKHEIPLEKLKFGIFIDDKFINFKDINQKIEYIINTNIIQITSIIDNIEITTYLYASYKNTPRIYVHSKINAMNFSGSKAIKMFYNLNPISKNEVFNVDDDFLQEENMRIKSLNNMNTFYLANSRKIDNISLKSKKLTKIHENKNRSENENILVISDLGNISKYEKKEDFSVIAFDERTPDFLDIKYTHPIGEQIPLWKHWLSNIPFDNLTDTEQKIMHQNFSLLKTFNAENNSLSFDYNDQNDIDTKLKITLAFLEGGHLDKGFENLNCLLDNYIKQTDLESLTDFENFAKFLNLFAKYINKSSNTLFLQKNYVYIVNYITEPIYNKLKNTKNISTLESASSLYNLSIILKDFSDELEWFIPDGLLTKYRYQANDMISKFKNKKLEKIKISEIKVEDLYFLVRSGLISNNKLTQFLLSFKTENTELNNYKTYRMIDKIIVIKSLYEIGDFDEAMEIKKELDQIIMDNNYIIPEYVKQNNNIYKYGEEGIDLNLAAEYILMIYDREKLRSKYGYQK